jgi:hypothetical protein
MHQEKKEICYKCRYLVVSNGGFFKRKSKKGPCDRCLGQMTTFQIALESTIWLRYILPSPNLPKDTNETIL